MCALHKEAELGQVDALRQQLGAGADIAASNSLGWTPLHTASIFGRDESVRVLLEAAEEQGLLDAVLKAVDSNGDTPLDVCDARGCFSLLVQRGGRGRQEALHRAVMHGYVEAFKQLLGAGADVAASDSGGWTALHWASCWGREECVGALLEAAEEQGLLDAVLNAVNNYGRTPLDVCDDRSCFSLLMQRGGRGRLALHRAAQFGHVDALRQLLDAGADVAVSDSSGWTALHWACKEGKWKSVRVLLEAAEEQGRLDAVLKAVDSNGDTPLDVCGHGRCFSLLLQRGGRGRQVALKRSLGADVAESDSTGRTPLHTWSSFGFEMFVWVVLEAAEEQGLLDAVINAVDNEGRTPLDMCEARSCFSLLVQRGGRGRDALHKAAKWGLTDDLRELLSARANVATPDCTGRNALHWAAAEGWEECVRLLLEAAERQGRLDAVLSAVDQGGWTPLHLSWHEGCSSLMRQRQV